MFWKYGWMRDFGYRCGFFIGGGFVWRREVGWGRNLDFVVFLCLWVYVVFLCVYVCVCLFVVYSLFVCFVLVYVFVIVFMFI